MGEAQRAYYKRHAERIRPFKNAEMKRRRDADPEAARTRERGWAQRNPGRLRAKAIRRYGISVVRWLALFYLQGERCAICGCTKSDRRGWATDHDHETGEVRGILCQRCNLCLGWLGETFAVVRSRVDRIDHYLKGT